MCTSLGVSDLFFSKSSSQSFFINHKSYLLPDASHSLIQNDLNCFDFTSFYLIRFDGVCQASCNTPTHYR